MIARLRPETTYRELWSALLSPAPEGGWSHRFADLFVRELGLMHAPIFTPSGRAALYYLFVNHPHDIVYMPAYTCWVVLEAARLANKKVEFLDVEYPGFQVRDVVYEKIRTKPGIVIATHQFGYPVDVERVCMLLHGRGHFIVEDCAGAMFSGLRGTPVGRLGDAAIFSFELAKLFTIGGGALVCRDPELESRIRQWLERHTRLGSLRSVPAAIMARKFITSPLIYRWLLSLYLLRHAPTEGEQKGVTSPDDTYNLRFTEGQARLGVQLAQRIRKIIERRRALFELYSAVVDEIPGLRPVSQLAESEICPIRFPFLVIDRDKYTLYEGMRARGVDSGFSFSYSLGDGDTFPEASRMAREIMNLPIYSGITDRKAHHITAALRASMRQ